MDWTILSLIYLGMVSVLLYYYFCRCCKAAFRWYWSISYTALSCGLAVCRALDWIGGFSYVLFGILLLTVFGMLFHKCGFLEALSLSSLTISVYSITSGIMQSFTYFVLSNSNSEIVLKYADCVQYAIVIILLILTFRIILKYFFDNMQRIHQPALLVLIIPVLFVTLVETVVSDAFYGNNMIWDTTEGLIYPIVNNLEILILRLFACCGFFSALIAYQKLQTSIKHEQTIHLLEQQTKNQEVYVREAQSRYVQTRSFRHDIKNHLLILHQLLKEGQLKEADEYIATLEEVSDSLSFQVNTGNMVVNALLSSKLAVAAQNRIHLQCSVLIPEQNHVSDLDWCIVLSNALDNAISASHDLPDKDRWINLSVKQKGNIYLLNIENRCLEDTKLPLEGIGLSNIKAVLQKYNGKMEIDIADNVFKLNALFIIPQHLKAIPQQFY